MRILKVDRGSVYMFGDYTYRSESKYTGSVCRWIDRCRECLFGEHKYGSANSES